jgi:HAE1 family hydrophobic/amphiphilic exporter-1
LIFSILCFGVLSLQQLPVALLPVVERPALTVRCSWEGASPELVEQRIAEPLESMLSSVAGVESVVSYARSGVALLTLQFSWKQDMDLAFLSVREKLDQARFMLPEQAARPVLIRANPSDEAVAVVALGIKDAKGTFEEKTQLWRWTDRVFVRRLEQMEGVGQAITVGAVQPQVHVILDQQRMLAHGVTQAQVAQRIQEVNMFTAAGELQDGWYRYTVKMEGRFTSVQELGETPVARLGTSKVLLLRDIARFEETEQQPVSFAQSNGKPVLSVLVKPAWGANTVQVFSELQPVLESLRAQYPEFSIKVLRESASMVSAAISQLLQALALGSVLAFLVLYVFLRDPLLPFAIGISIPLSLAATFIVMYLTGIQLNIMSLSGLTLGVGLLVDNAIVVLENIKRFREEGYPLTEAARRGAGEVALPATASTLTTISVFLPLVLLGEAEGAWFKEQALTLSYSLLASLAVALGILPALAVFFSRAKITQPVVAERIQQVYERMLEAVFAHKKRFLAGFAGLALSCALLASAMERSTFPAMASHDLGLEIVLPENTTLARTREAAGDVARWIAGKDSAAAVLALGGFTDQTRPEQMSLEKLNRFTLKLTFESAARKMLFEPYLDELRRLNPDWRIGTTSEGLLSGMGYTEENNFATVLFTGQQRDRLHEAADAFTVKMTGVEGVLIQPVFPENITVLELRPRQEVWVQYGLSSQEILMQLEAHGLGQLATRWSRQEQSEEIRLFIPDDVYASLWDKKIRLQTANWTVKDLFDIHAVDQPEVLVRQFQGRQVALRMVCAYGRYRELEPVIKAHIGQLALDYQAEVRLAGPHTDTGRLLKRITSLLLFSVVIIFLILAMQYESLGYPLLILFSIPFAWMGALVMLWIAGQSLNLFSTLGILILTGIAVNDAILKIDYMRRYYDEHGDAYAAAIQAGKNRFRPVVMTTLTTILGLVPLLLPFGDAAEIRYSLGAALIGGMVSSTLLTLFLLPVLFTGYHSLFTMLKKSPLFFRTAP